MDGLTYGAKINIAIGSFELVNESDLEDFSSEPQQQNSSFANNNFSLNEMGQLRNMLMNQ
jgi:hypothetical protein